MVNDFLCISNFRKPRWEKESLVAPSEKISPYIFVVSLLFLFRRVQALWREGVCAHHSCPTLQIQKVSSWSLCQVRFQLLFLSLSKNLVFSCKLWQSACDTYNIKSTLGFQEKANYLDGAAPLRKQRREHILLCIHFTLRHITSQVPPVFHSSQNSARPPTRFFGQLADPEKQQRSSREEEASTACKAAPRGKELLAGHKEGQLRLALEWAMQRGRTTEVMRRKGREEREHQGKELSSSTAVNSPKFPPSSWFPSFQK